MTAAARRRILVLGADTQSFLAVIRSLGRAGVEVHVAWCPLDSAALASRYVHAVHELPAFGSDDASWIPAFQELFRRERFDLVLPITDMSALPFQLHRELFEPQARIYLLPNDVYRTCADKKATWNLARSLGIPVPRQSVVANVTRALAAAGQFGYPLVLKPTSSADSRHPFGRREVKKARGEAELIESSVEASESQPILVQENLIGIGVGVEVLCKDGRILLVFQHERVHEPANGGGSSYRRSAALHPGMLDAATKLMRALSYTGVAMVEFKHDRATDRWALIEINARFWGSLALSSAAGMDFPIALVDLLLNGREPTSRKYRVGMYCRHWSRDLQWFLGNLRADKSDRTLQTRRLSSILLESLNIVSLRERSDTFSLSDPLPAWRDLRLFFDEKLFRVLKHSRPYRSLQRRRLDKLFRSADRVVVLCHGNICRSPFAAAALASRFDVSAASRGVHPAANRPSPADAIAAAAEKGIGLSKHRSAVVEPDELRSADLVLIFDRQNWLSLRALAPDCMGRVAYIGAADPSRPLEIPDPYGKDLRRFRDCYDHIDAAVALMRKSRKRSRFTTHVFSAPQADKQTPVAQLDRSGELR